MTSALALDFLTVPEAAAICRVHRNTICEWCRTGRLEAYRLGQRDWRIPRAALERFIDRARMEVTA